MQFARRLEILANVAIFCVSILLGFVLLKRYVFVDESHKQPPAGPSAGTKLSVPGVAWQDSEATLLVVLKQGCPFCAESAPFYQRLATTAKDRRTRLVVGMAEPPPAIDAYLSSLQVPIPDRVQVRLADLQVGGVPTLVLVDKQGVVQKAWRGALDAGDQADVLAHLP